MEKLELSAWREDAEVAAEYGKLEPAVHKLVVALRLTEDFCNALAAKVAALAPESAPPVPVTVPDSPPAAPAMTEAQFWLEMDQILQAARCANRLRKTEESGVLYAAVDLGARWRAATGLPLPTRPRKASR